MVDVDRRLNIGHQAHAAGLKRLSARASNGPLKPTASPRKGCFSFAPLAHEALDRLRKGKVEITKGLTDEEFCRIEAPFAFTFPPDLKAILQQGLPLGAGFPDWRSGSFKQLRLLFNIPIVGLTYEVARERFWLKQWGPKPSSSEEAVAIARCALKKAPILIPVYNHCYIPASPNLAGNPIFFVRQQEVFCCGSDLADFFAKQEFVLRDCQIPCNFIRFDPPSGRVSDSKALPTQSFRESSKPYLFTDERLGSDSKEREEDKENLDYRSGRGSANRTGEDLEGWGRNLDAMAKKGHDAASRGSCDSIMRRHFNSVDLSSEHFANDRVASLTGTSVSRRIEFWTDLAKKRLAINSSFAPSIFDDFYSSRSSRMVTVETSYDRLMDGNESLHSFSADSNAIQGLAPTPYWLERYFDNMAVILRDGGWRESDISEMFDVDLLSNGWSSDLAKNPQSMMQGLVLYVDLLSDVLQRAGWSTNDVAEAFDVDFTFYEQKRRVSVPPPHVMTKICKLAEYAAHI